MLLMQKVLTLRTLIFVLQQDQKASTKPRTKSHTIC